MTTSVRIRLAAAMFLLVGACATDPGADPGLGDDDVLDGKFDDASTTGATLDYKSYEVLFTNPLCRTYEYDTPVETVDGEETLARKPKNVFCTKAADFGNSASRPISPQFRLLEWIKGLGAGDEVFLAYLSFSNSAMGGELCKAAQRGVKVTFVLDAPTDLSPSIGATTSAHDGPPQQRQTTSITHDCRVGAPRVPNPVCGTTLRFHARIHGF